MSPDTYLTLADRGRAAFTVRGSEFIGHATPVEGPDAAATFVETVRAEYDDATHNVPAYRVRVDGGPLREYSSDDGEPSGSAGKPMLNVLQGEALENCAVVVTRYYGGTNLGIGGLVRAYGRATKDAIAASEIVEERPHAPLGVVVDYDDSGTVRAVLERTGVEFEADYAARVRFDARVPVAEYDALTDRLRSVTSGRVTLETATDR